MGLYVIICIVTFFITLVTKSHDPLSISAKAEKRQKSKHGVASVPRYDTVEAAGAREHVGGCQNDGPFLGTLNIGCRTIRDPERDHNFHNHPCKRRKLHAKTRRYLILLGRRG